MSVNQFVRFAAQILFIALSAVALFNYMGHRDARRRDFAMLACSLGIPLGISFLKDAFGIRWGAVDLLGACLLFSQPYFLFRLLQYYRPSRRWTHVPILLGMVLCWVAIYFFIAPYPVATQVIVFGYCVIVDAYCTWEYSRGIQNSVGIFKRRLMLIAISSGLFTLAVAGNMVKPLVPEVAQSLSTAALAVTAISAVLYYLAFVPPHWLRNAWQFEELRSIATPITSFSDRRSGISESFQQLCSAASQAVNGMVGAVVRWDQGTTQWMIAASTTPTFVPHILPNGQQVIEQVWKQRQPLAIYVPDIRQFDERRRMQAVGARSWLLVPILTAETIWGVLIVLLRDRSLFIDDDLNLLDLFTQQCAIVLENRRLVDELQGYSTQLEQKVEERTGELRESEARFRHLADSAPVMIWMTDVQGHPIYFNQQWYDFIGLSPPIGAEFNWFDAAIYADDAQRANATFMRGHRQRKPFRQEYRLRRHDGEYRWLFDSAIPRIDHNGDLVGYIGSILDITDRKNAEERLQVIHQMSEAVNRAEEVEQIYEQALSGLEHVLSITRAAILLFDHNGTMRIQAWRGLSAAYRAATDGQLPQVINERDPQPVLIPNVTEVALAPYQQVAIDEGIRAIGYIPLVAQSRLLGKFMLYYNQPHSFSDAEVQWAETIARHVAYALQRKQAEAKLRTYTHTLEELNHIKLSSATEVDIQHLLQMTTEVATELSGAHFGVFFYHESWGRHNGDSGEGHLLYALSGFPHEALTRFARLRFGDGLDPTAKGGTSVRLADVTQAPRDTEITLWDTLPSELLPVRSYLAVPVSSHAESIIGGLFFGHGKPDVFTDEAEQIVSSLASQVAITLENARLYVQIKESETALRELNTTLEERIEKSTAELRRSNEELDQFAYIASHDLKAPLRGIRFLANWIEQDAAEVLPSGSKEHLAKLQACVQRMEALLDDLLAYSRAGRKRNPVELVDISELIHSLVDIIAPPPGFMIKIVGELPVMQVERPPLETVFRNLVGNAIKHHHRVSDGSVEIRALELEHFVEFTVTDDGPGIAPEYHQRVFEMFQTLQPRDQVEGSGIGLAIVKKAVESHGGTVEVESARGEGTAIRFTWPKIVTPDSK